MKTIQAYLNEHGVADCPALANHLLDLARSRGFGDESHPDFAIEPWDYFVDDELAALDDDTCDAVLVRNNTRLMRACGAV